MTALDRYVRLEASGLWREAPGAAPREVVVSFGNATLTLKDLADAPLGHWALAGVGTIGRDGGATVYSMTDDGAETLAIRDPAMIEAIAAVAGRAPLARPRRRRRRLPLTPLVVVAALAGAAWAAPRYLHPDPALLVPADAAAEAGDRMLIELAARTGPPCPGAPDTLDRLAARLTAPLDPPRLRLVPLGGVPVAALPGGTVLLDAGLAAAPAEVLAGWAAVGMGRAPEGRLLAAAGPVADLRLLATGRLDDAALARAATDALAAPAADEAAPALARLAAARIDPAPFLAALAAAGLPADPPAPAAVTAIPDRDRDAIRGACGPSGAAPPTPGR